LGLVTWVVGANSSVVAFIAPDGTGVAAPIPRGRTAIEGAVRRLREATVSGDRELLKRLTRELRFELLPDAIVARIAAHKTAAHDRILLLLHGPLERLPI